MTPKIICIDYRVMQENTLLKEDLKATTLRLREVEHELEVSEKNRQFYARMMAKMAGEVSGLRTDLDAVCKECDRLEKERDKYYDFAQRIAEEFDV